MLGWHFLPNDGRMRYGDRRSVVAGETYTVDSPIELCNRGLHASKRILDALRYAPGNIVCRVELGGEIIEGHDKAVATERTVLWMVDAERVLHEFACRVAEDALQSTGVTDARCWNAIEAKRRWLNGDCTDKELAAAWFAARDAAWGAAWGAAGAWSAARDAAWGAAWGAAWDKYNGWLDDMVTQAHKQEAA